VAIKTDGQGNTVRRGAGKYWERLAPVAEFEYDEGRFEVRVFDDIEEAGCLHVQFCRCSKSGMRVATFDAGSYAELAGMCEELGALAREAA